MSRTGTRPSPAHPDLATGSRCAPAGAGTSAETLAETPVGASEVTALTEVTGITGVTKVTGVTPDGAAWLASAGTYPRSTLAHWRERPDAPVVLPCGSAFDVVNVPAIFGRRMLDRLWDEGPGSGPVAVHRGRMLLFASPGTAHRLPSLLEWEEWGSRGREDGGGRTGGVPPLLCHGNGDAVTVPAPVGSSAAVRSASRWLVAPDTRHPWLPGPEILVWAAVRAARSAVRISIFPPADQDANVYDVSRRR